MFIYFVVVAFMAAVRGDPIVPKHSYLNSRIAGGENALIETYPYQASLQEGSDAHICGAAIISSNYIVTAARCIDSEYTKYTVRVGSSYRNENGSVREVEKIIVHHQFFVDSYDVPVNDIAVIKLKEPLVFDESTQPIDLYESGEKATPLSDAVITGWGTNAKGGVLADQLQTATVVIRSLEQCQRAYDNFNGLRNGQICASYGHSGFCTGDIGGPLAIDGRLAGIISWSNGCADKYYPGIYTEIAYYRDWINERAELA